MVSSRLDLAASMAARINRLAEVGGDAIEVLDGFLLRLELGAERYGALVLASDRRNWQQEQDEEIADYAVYRALSRLSRNARHGARREVETGAEGSPHETPSGAGLSGVVQFDLSSTEDA